MRGGYCENCQDILAMEGNSYEMRPNSWKHSIIKHNTYESRIMADNKDLPTKFSPGKYADPLAHTSKSLFRSKILSKSHEDIALADLASSKEKQLQKKSIIQTPREMNEIPMQLKGAESEESLTLKLDSPRKMVDLKRNSANSLDVIREHKIQYFRFKERVLSELKKQEEAIKQAVNQIMRIITNTTTATTTSQRLSRSAVQYGIPHNRPELPTHIASFGSPVSVKVPKLNIPHIMAIDTKKYRESLTSEQAQIESVMPKIKERVSKMFDLMGKLQSEINEQSVNLLPYDSRLPASHQAQQ